MLKSLKLTSLALAGCLFFIGCGGGAEETTPAGPDITIPADGGDADAPPAEGE